MSIDVGIDVGIDRFWQEFLSARNKAPSTEYRESFYFGSNEKSANGLLALVLAGKKKATSSSLRAYELEGARVPRPGDYSIVTDWGGNPRCVIETTDVTILPFNEMKFDICKREGEDDNLESWQANHRRFFAEDGKEIGYEFEETMLIVFEDFEVVFQK